VIKKIFAIPLTKGAASFYNLNIKSNDREEVAPGASSENRRVVQGGRRERRRIHPASCAPKGFWTRVDRNGNARYSVGVC